jgi:type III secretory pathway component EscU
MPGYVFSSEVTDNNELVNSSKKLENRFLNICLYTSSNYRYNTMHIIRFIEIIAAFAIVATTIAAFGFIAATAQTTTGNITQGSNNMTSSTNATSGNTTMQSNQVGNISGCDRCF